MSTTIREELKTIAATSPDDERAVQVAGLALEQLLLADSSAESDDLVAELGNEVVQSTTRIYEAYETNLENAFAKELLRGKARVEDYPMYARFRRLITKEIETARVGSKDKVLFIGSGPFPISPILINELSGASVDCFDLSEEACVVSQEVLEKLGLQDSINVINLMAQEAELPTISTPGEMGRHNVVFVALLAQPKPEIMHRLWLSVGPNPRIIVRNAEGNRRFIYAGMDPSEVGGRQFQKVGEYHAGPDDTISGVVLKTDAQPWIFRI